MTARRFGRLSRMTYNVQEPDAAALRSGELNPDLAFVSALGVPEPEHEQGRIVGVEWRLDLDPPCVVVTMWSPT